MSRGRKPSNIITSITWDDIFWKNLPTYINILNSYLNSVGFELVEVSNLLDKLPFKLPKGLNSKEINSKGMYPVISQSKEFIIGFNDNSELLVKDCFPLIVFGDHSKTIKYVEKPFIIGADGVKILKPIKSFNEKFFYYFLHGVITDTKDYGRHFSLLRKGVIANVTDVDLQNSIVNFLDDLSKGIIDNDKFYFNYEIEIKIYNLQKNQLKQIEISSELTHQLNLIKQLRQAFLREAMQGRFEFPQQPLTEALEGNGLQTGHELLAKIKAEKAKLIAEKKLKKEKELSPISEDEIPFEIPDHWAWCRFQDITKVITCGLASTPIYRKEGRMFLSAKNIKPFRFMPENFKYVDEETYRKVTQNAKPEINDILITRVGAGIGETALIDKEIDFAYYVSLTLVKPFNKISSNYLQFWLNSPTGIQSAISFTTGSGSSQGNLNVEKVRSFLIPIPPLHEQEQIVSKLEELMKFCDSLEQSIKESQGYNEMLLQQVLREALQGEAIAV